MTFLKSLVGLAMLVCSAQEMDTSLFSALRWRNIGPFRAGRVTAVAGIPDTFVGTPAVIAWTTSCCVVLSRS